MVYLIQVLYALDALMPDPQVSTLDSYGNAYISGILQLEYTDQEVVLFKNPKNDPPDCVEIYWDVLSQLTVVFTIIGSCIFYKINKRWI
jgi:hypothetical protein